MMSTTASEVELSASTSEESHVSSKHDSVLDTENVQDKMKDGGKKDPPMHHLSVDTETFDLWRQIATDQQFEEDTDVAAFLIQHFQKTPSRCSTCDSPLTWCCPRCASASATSLQNKTMKNSPVKEEPVHKREETMAMVAADEAGDDSDEADANSNRVKTAVNDSVMQVTRRRSARRRTPRKGVDVTGGVNSVMKKLASGQQMLANADGSTESEEYQLYTRLAVKFSAETEGSNDLADPDFVPDNRHKDYKLKVKLRVPKTRKCRNVQRSTASKRPKLTAKRGARKGLAGAKSSLAPFLANAADMESAMTSTTRPRRQLGLRERRFECEKCKASFLGSNDLRRHMRTHTGERPFVCEKCGAAFALASTLKRHTLSHTGHRPYHCEECGSAFYSEAALQKHQRLHSGDRPYLCEECGAAFIQPSNLQAHIKKNHTGDMPYSCKVCCARFKTANHLSIHEKLHTGEERPYQCSECGVSFPSYVEMKEHKRIHVSKREFKCRQCESVFKTSKLLTRHMETHGADAESICVVSLSVSNQEFVSPHVSSKNDSRVTTVPTQYENDAGRFSCNLCNEKLATLEDWKQHTQTHRQQKSFTCKTCGSTFKTSTKLKEHIRTHTGEKPFICTECNAGFSNLTNLKAHTRRHTGFKPYVCKTCNAAFTIASNLKAHVRTHTGERPYACNQCSLAFTQAASLRRHMRTHSGDRPYVCEQCGACFAAPANLKRHAKTHAHTGRKPTTCEKCGAHFTIPANMQTRERQNTQSLCCGCSSGLVSVPSVISISAPLNSVATAGGVKNILQSADTVDNAVESAVVTEGNNIGTDIGLDSSHMQAIKITLETLYNSQ